MLDILLRGEDTWSFLTEIKHHDDTRAIPVVVITTIDDQQKVLALGADAYYVKPIDRYRLLHTLTRVTAPQTARRILVVDDEEISRYLLRQHLVTPQQVVSEAASGADAIRLAHAEKPDVICLDLMMPDADGFEVLRALRKDPVTQDIPVVIVTSKHLHESERRQLLQMASSILSKEAPRESALAAVEEALRLAGPAA